MMKRSERVVGRDVFLAAIAFAAMQLLVFGTFVFYEGGLVATAVGVLVVCPVIYGVSTVFYWNRVGNPIGALLAVVGLTLTADLLAFLGLASLVSSGE